MDWLIELETLFEANFTNEFRENNILLFPGNRYTKFNKYIHYLIYSHNDNKYLVLDIIFDKYDINEIYFYKLPIIIDICTNLTIDEKLLSYIFSHKNVNINCTTPKYKMTALHYLCSRRLINPQLLCLFLNRNDLDINIRDEFGRNLLQYLVIFNKHECLKYLLN